MSTAVDRDHIPILQNGTCDKSAPPPELIEWIRWPFYTCFEKGVRDTLLLLAEICRRVVCYKPGHVIAHIRRSNYPRAPVREGLALSRTEAPTMVVASPY